MIKDAKKLLFIFGLITFVFSLNLLIYAQTKETNQPKIKDFGSSLKNKKIEKKTAQSKQNNDSNEEIIKIKTDLVVNSVLVADKKGNFIKGLTKEDFIITDDGKPQEISVFSLGDNAAIPRSIVLIIDYSGSQFPYLKTSVEAAKRLIDKLNPTDRMAIVTDSVELLANFTSDKKLLKKKLDSLIGIINTQGPEGLGLSLQYTALMATLNELFDNEETRPIIIFQTDGDELSRIQPEIDAKKKHIPDRLLSKINEYKQFDFEELKEKIENSRATIYTIIPGISLIGILQEEQIKRAKLQFVNEAKSIKLLANSSIPVEEPSSISEENWINIVRHVLKQQLALGEISDLSGGWADFLQVPEQADELYSRIFSDINYRYVIGYYPVDDERNVKRRIVKIEVRNHPEFTILGRKTHYTPNAEK